MRRTPFASSVAAVVAIGVLVACSCPNAAAQSALFFPEGYAVGAVGDDVLTTRQQVAAFRYDGTTGALVQTFPDPTPATSLQSYGQAVAGIGGDVLVGEPGGFTTGGFVYLFDGTTGALLRTFNPAPLDDDDFGWALAASGGNVIVGAPRADGVGAAYLFDAATGAQLQSFHPTLPQAGFTVNLFGWSVAALGDDVLVGAPWDDTAATDQGAVYRFDGTTGALEHVFASPVLTGSAKLFGTSIATLGNDVVVGAPGIGFGTAAVYLFDGTTGALKTTFSDPFESFVNTGFGDAVATLGGAVLVSAHYLARVFVFDATTGALLRTIGPSVGGESVMGGSLTVVGGNPVLGLRAYSFSPSGAYLACGGVAGCGPCETCAPLGGCVAAANPSCRTPVARTTLGLVNSSDDARDGITWTGTTEGREALQVPLGDFGTTTQADYTLCLFDESGPTPALTFRAAAPAGGDCAGQPCWKRRRGFTLSYGGPGYVGATYKDRERTPDGLDKIMLRSVIEPGTLEPAVSGGGLAGIEASKVFIKGKGPNLSNRPFGLPATPLALPLRVQLQARDALCWEGRYSASGVAHNTVRSFSGSAD